MGKKYENDEKYIHSANNIKIKCYKKLNKIRKYSIRMNKKIYHFTEYTESKTAVNSVPAWNQYP